ncbi:MAG: dienelactone hydrolase family protein [Azospirillaceae bacterium]
MPRLPAPARRALSSIVLAASLALPASFGMATAASAADLDRLTRPWPDGEALAGVESFDVRFATADPFILSDAGDPEASPPRDGHGRLFLPPPEAREAPMPAVVLVHGAGGVIGRREPTYARQFAAMGFAAIVVDAFAARRDLATGFVDRLLSITETMLVADAYGALDYLAAREDVDGDRVALIGFSYGAMASVFAVYDQVAEAVAPGGPRFAAHAAFYGPCIARFEDPATTGAPVIMLAGTEDAIVDPERCAEIADDLDEAGSRVRQVWYDGAYHQWDGSFAGPRPIGRNLAPCSLSVDGSGIPRDRRSGLPMLNGFLRKVILGLCVGGEGYLIGRDDEVRARSNRDLGAFLQRALSPRKATAGDLTGDGA